MTVLYNQYCEI